MINVSSLVLSLLPKAKILFALDIFPHPALPLSSSSCFSWFPLLFLTGFLQITPEGSPQAERKGEVAGMEDVSGSFCIHASGLDFAAQQMSEEHHVSASEEGTVTMVTKTTRITRQIVTSQTHTAESSTTTSGQVSDSNF